MGVQDEFVSGSGSGETTLIDYVNRNQQKCLGTRGNAGNDHFQKAYKMKCQLCDTEYGSNGTDVFQRKCPKCQDGIAGIDF